MRSPGSENKTVCVMQQLATPAVDGSWTQECTDWNLGQDRRQNNEQRPLQKAAMDKE